MYSKEKSLRTGNERFRLHSCKQIGQKKTEKTDTKYNYKMDFNALYASLLVNENVSVTDWHVDSGATSHMTNKSNILFNRKEAVNKKVVVANNSKIPINCVGDVKMSLDNKKNISRIVRNVEYTQAVCANLLSVRHMTKSGNNVIFERIAVIILWQAQM